MAGQDFTRTFVFVSIAVMASACSETRSAPTPATTSPLTARPNPVTTLPSTVSTFGNAPSMVVPSASSPASNAKHGDCAILLRRPTAKDSDTDSIQFIDCNERPQQTDYPECYFYLIERSGESNVDPAGCLPSFVTVTLTGFQTIPDGLHAKLEYATGRPNEINLRLTDAPSTFPGVTGRTGSLFGTISFENGIPKEFKFGHGMRSQTGKTSLRVMRED